MMIGHQDPWNPSDNIVSIVLILSSILTEKYFDMKKVQCKEGLDIYKKFLTRMTRISEFLKVAEVSGRPRSPRDTNQPGTVWIS